MQGPVHAIEAKAWRNRVPFFFDALAENGEIMPGRPRGMPLPAGEGGLEE